MRMLPNEFDVRTPIVDYRAPEVPSITLPILIAMSPVLLVWWAALSILVGGKLAARSLKSIA